MQANRDRRRTGRSRNLLIIGITVVVGSALLFVYLSSRLGESSTQVASTSKEGGSASLQIETTQLDLGSVSVSQDTVKEIRLANTGSGELQISKVNTSCMCTFAQLVIDGEEGPEFNMTMHMSPQEMNWVGYIPPGQSATLRVIYRPSRMPTKGRVDREIHFETNDPAHAQVKVYMRAFVTE